jgi:hypothetical protein
MVWRRETELAPSPSQPARGPWNHRSGIQPLRSITLSLAFSCILIFSHAVLAQRRRRNFL